MNAPLKISFVGFGNMAKALIQGLFKDEQTPLTIAASAPNLPTGITESGVITSADNCAIVCDADVVILAVKPQQMAAVLQEIRPVLAPRTLLVSIAAGLSRSWFASRIPDKQSLVRCMPNIAVAFNQGAIPLIANDHTTTEQKDLLTTLFNSIGITTWLENEQAMDAYTALSGSGPAYVFLFLEAMIKAAEQAGIAKETASQFALQTFKGALSFLENTGLNPEAARSRVTSRHGTTAAALQVFEQAGFEDLIAKAMEAARLRAQELALE